MIDEKRLEREYRKLQNEAAPDLWDRIEGRLKEHPERGERAGVEMETVRRETARRESARRETARRKYGRYGYGITAAAAAIAITVGLNIARNSGNMAAGTVTGVMEETMAAATKEAVMEELAPAASEAIAAESEAAGAYGQDGASPVAGAPQAETDGQSSLAQALSGGVVTWQQLSVAEYTALPVPEQAVTVPEDSRYFSEDILADTGLLCGARVDAVSFEYDSSRKAVKVVYDLTVDEVYYAEDYVASAERIQVKSPIIQADGDEAFLLYQLQTGGTYLLPLRMAEGAWELLYPFAPQVQVLKEGGYLFHTGYVSLIDSGTCVVTGQQEAANDYYYDRMLFRNDDSFLSDFLSLVEQS